jgi:hypothetical protein
MNPSKAKGTKAETAVVRYAQANGFPDAERLALHGANDIGDIRLAPGLILEVKAGKAAQTASLRQIDKWLVEAQQEADNAHADLCALIVQRRGFGIERVEWWEAWLMNVPLVTSLQRDSWISSHVPVITLSVKDAFEYFRADGYGQPL